MNKDSRKRDENVKEEEEDPNLRKALEMSRKQELLEGFERDNTTMVLNGKAVNMSTLSRESTTIQNFLSKTASQLTMTGLFKLHEDVRNNELCVFFRNNHFSTLLKRDGKIFLLLTDLGFEQQRNFVWEVLDGIDGDTTLATSKFKKAPPVANSEHVYDAAVQFASAFNVNSSADEGNYGTPSVTRQFSEEDDLALALRLQREENDQVGVSNNTTDYSMGNHNGDTFGIAGQQAELERLKQAHVRKQQEEARRDHGRDTGSRGRRSSGCLIA